MTVNALSTAADSGLGSAEVGAGCAGKLGPPDEGCAAEELGAAEDDELSALADEDGDGLVEEDDEEVSLAGSAAQPARAISDADVTAQTAGRRRMPLVS